jgi:hypothetical protein
LSKLQRSSLPGKFGSAQIIQRSSAAFERLKYYAPGRRPPAIRQLYKFGFCSQLKDLGVSFAFERDPLRQVRRGGFIAGFFITGPSILSSVPVEGKVLRLKIVGRLITAMSYPLRVVNRPFPELIAVQEITSAVIYPGLEIECFH